METNQTWFNNLLRDANWPALKRPTFILLRVCDI